MAREKDLIVFPELGQMEDPHTGNEVTGERMVSDRLIDTFESSGGLGSPMGADEGEKVFELEQRGTVAKSELGSTFGGSNEVTAEDVFIRGTRSRSRGSERDVPDPMEVHESRSEYAQRQDEARDARLTTDPEQYAKDPNSYDFPGVDTGPQFRESEGEDFDTSAFLDFQSRF